MRTIDADALQKVFIEECIQECSSCIYNKPWVPAEDGFGKDWQGCKLIDNAPTVEITDYDTGYQDGLEDGLNDIRPRGEWIPVEPDCRGYTEEFECSNCNNRVKYSYCMKESEYPICPNCGADMRGGSQ